MAFSNRAKPRHYHFWGAFFVLLTAMLAGVWWSKKTVPIDDSWTVASPESQGMQSAGLGALDAVLAERGTDAWLVLRQGKIIHEWYRDDRDRRFGAASMSKALVGGLSLMLAVDQGMVQLDDPVGQYLPVWMDDTNRQAITIRQLADHSSGLPHPRAPEDLGEDAQAWETAFWNRNNDLISLISTELPLLFEPGSDHGYSGPAYAVLSYVLTQALIGSPWQDLKSFLDDLLMRPLGLNTPYWTIGYRDDTFDADGLDVYASWGGAAFTARATARIGAMLLDQGRWYDEELLSPDVIQAATSFDPNKAIPPMIAEGMLPAPALGWWSNEFGALPSLPKDAYLGAGAGHRVLVVVPSLDLVLVRYGTRLGEDHWGGDYWTSLDQILLAPIIELIADTEVASNRY